MNLKEPNMEEVKALLSKYKNTFTDEESLVLISLFVHWFRVEL